MIYNVGILSGGINMGFFNKDNKQEESNLNQATSTSIQPQVKKRLYLVDYENVSDAGLVGVDQLTGFDSVVIFYGSKVKTIAYESLISITSSNAAIEHLKAEKTAKNYLDFQLTTYLGYKLGKDNYEEVFVISKDSGFDAVVDFWASKGVKIKRQIAIIEPVKEEPASTEEKPARPKRTYTRRTGTNTRTRKSPTRANVTTNPKPRKTQAKQVAPKDMTRSELRTALKDCGLSAPEYRKVYDAFDKSTSSSAYNNSLQKAFGNDRTSVIYKATGKIFERVHSAL